MKLSSRHLPLMFLFAALVAFAACSKDGAQGPAGNPGAAGPAGPAGPAGANGPKGDTGVANVIYSQWLNVTFDTIRDQNNVATTDGFVGFVDVPKLTKDILTKGTINVYFNLDSADHPYIVPLPYVDPYLFVSFRAEEGGLTIIASHDFSSGNFPGQKIIQQFRYVLIPGGVAARSANVVDWKDYKSVQRYLGLKD
ncbi:hypothetical protein [Chitinophaga arvensicola]|uniref:Collagen triple helix repeat-containing protein n=1 Tax=Chitinophaga arvensicola TaxID=29529 RepID=A0A1I0SC45_9BACT|nr:hypothetical protein [Chitinophaga arvensicola]SEW54402.1 hypothetical protein SAMN04488122_6019 [Chitinophaga arvensicola]